MAAVGDQGSTRAAARNQLANHGFGRYENLIHALQLDPVTARMAGAMTPRTRSRRSRVGSKPVRHSSVSLELSTICLRQGVTEMRPCAMQSRREGERRRSSAVAVGPSRRRSSAVPMNYPVRCGAQAAWRCVSNPLYFLFAGC